MMDSSAPAKHILTVDVEDYFQVEAFASRIPRESWGQFPSRVVRNTRRLLDLFDRFQVSATFFVLGWVAARFPELALEISSRGHELACHSFWHRRIDSLTPLEFRADTRAARETIEQAGSVRISGYRAPTWSITSRSLWALDVLAEEGFTYDSSIFPVHHDLYGIPGANRFQYEHVCANGKKLTEIPPATLKFGGLTIPAAGGGYLRIFPLRISKAVFRQFEEKGHPVVLYIHPWEVDPDQPRLAGSLKSRFRHYTNLQNTESRLADLLAHYAFESFRDRLGVENPARRTSQSAFHT